MKLIHKNLIEKHESEINLLNEELNEVKKEKKQWEEEKGELIKKQNDLS